MSIEEIFGINEEYGIRTDFLNYDDYKEYLNDELKEKMEDLMDDGYCFSVSVCFDDEDDADSSANISWFSEEGASGMETTKDDFVSVINDYAEDMVSKATKDRDELLEWMTEAINETESGDDITMIEICQGNSYEFLSDDDVDTLYVNYQDYLEEKTEKKIERHYYDYYGIHIGVAVWSVAA